MAESPRYTMGTHGTPIRIGGKAHKKMLKDQANGSTQSAVPRKPRKKKDKHPPATVGAVGVKNTVRFDPQPARCDPMYQPLKPRDNGPMADADDTGAIKRRKVGSGGVHPLHDLELMQQELEHVTPETEEKTSTPMAQEDDEDSDSSSGSEEDSDEENEEDAANARKILASHETELLRVYEVLGDSEEFKHYYEKLVDKLSLDD